MKSISTTVTSVKLSRLRKLGLGVLFILPILAVGVMLRPQLDVHAVDMKPVNAGLNPVNIESGFADMIEAVSPSVVSIRVAKEFRNIEYQSQMPPQIEEFFRQFRDQYSRPFRNNSFEYESKGNAGKFAHHRTYGDHDDDHEYVHRNQDMNHKHKHHGKRNHHRHGEEGHHGNKGKHPHSRYMRGAGAGVIFDPEGYVVTNMHVVENADDILVTLSGGEEYEAKLIGGDKLTDLAVLKVDADEPLPYSEFGDSNRARVGDWVLAIGDPYGLTGSVSFGVISAIDRTLPNRGVPQAEMIQIDAAINTGNSGGPLINTSGQVIGINTMIFSPTGANAGIGFSIPANTVKDIASSLAKSGNVERGWLGVVIQDISADFAEALNLDPADAHGALVSSVQAGGPAAAAGIEEGDIVISYDGEKVEDTVGLRRAVQQTEPGSNVQIGVRRDGEIVTLNTEISMLGGTQYASNEMDEDGGTRPQLNIAVAELTDEMRMRAGIEGDVGGVVVTEVNPGPAMEAGIREGDVIVKFNRKSVSGAEDLRSELRKIVKAGDNKILVLVHRNGISRFNVITLS